MRWGEPGGKYDPNVFTIGVSGNIYIKFRKDELDEDASWYEFSKEKDVRVKYWYPNIKKGDIVVDVGAAWGVYAITAASLGAIVHAFEPDPDIIKGLIINLDLNKFESPCKVNELGLSDITDGRLIRLDDYPLEGLDHIKIDVEGQELQVLMGARESIRKNKPSILLEAHLSYDKAMLNKAAEYIFGLVEGYELEIYDCVPSRDTIYGYFYIKK